MSDISKINPDNGLNVYDLKDSICRTALTVNDPTEGNGVITFGVDANGNYGYKKVGADTVTPFSNNDSEVHSLSFVNTTSNTASIERVSRISRIISSSLSFTEPRSFDIGDIYTCYFTPATNWFGSTIELMLYSNRALDLTVETTATIINRYLIKYESTVVRAFGNENIKFKCKNSNGGYVTAMFY